MGKQNDKELTQSTNKQSFLPTAHMMVWLDTAIENASDSPKEIAELSRIDRTNWYKWLKVEGFEDWYWSEYDRKIRRLKPLVDSLGVKFAKRGSPQHFEYLAKRVGNLREEDKSPNNIKKRIVAEEFFEI